jgi:hypothetical protein
MSDPSDIHDLLAGDPTTVFDNTELLADPFWAKLDAGSLPEAYPQPDSNPTQHQISRQPREEEDEEKACDEGDEAEEDAQDCRDDPLLL